MNLFYHIYQFFYWTYYTSESDASTHYWDVTGFKSSTSYDPEVIGWLQEVGYVSNYSQNATSSNAPVNSPNPVSALTNNPQYKQLIITKAGVLRAREILARLGIQDWDKAEILGSIK